MAPDFVRIMPQGNLETLESACADGFCNNKIVCKTLVAIEDDSDDHLHSVEKLDGEDIPSNFPPESFWLSKDPKLDWFDCKALFERKESNKRNSAPNSTNRNSGLNSNSNSQCFVRNSKASIIELQKPQKSCFVEAKNMKNSNPENTNFFPKRFVSIFASLPPEQL